MSALVPNVSGRLFRDDERAPVVVEYEPNAARPSGPENGNWVPANGYTEAPFVTRNRYRLLYCWQPSTGRHAYLNCDTDIILTDAEAMAALGMY